ncbi:MBL fold metallo-hydrolase [Kitasatospora sp. DSM 101779]|uniref:MBL fold metallo-hydrolase n=1 Tax=Kitasatospora sp. DSM 101779 TaxID=2853165 RepID=UPI0021D8A6FD|nr:MBL fold metallo-hydrolase [Kitasatospora sp. DSM 101779]MCU7822190.1 MBL fold metallo-hydrolase [Kitasatospora sp. DSM 101779]
MSTFSTEHPADDVIEVSLFGPGKGESIVVHLGARRWLVVDSCRDQRTKEVAALTYLRGVGVDLVSEVYAVVATHAHDDHFAGIAEIVEACTSAVIVTSQALMSREFLALVEADREIAGLTNTSAYREYRRIFELAEARRDQASGRKPLRLAGEGKSLLTLPASPGVSLATVTALSPSDEAVTKANEILAKNHLHAMGERTHRSEFDPNEASIALWVNSGAINILLGADLLSGPSGCGWGGVLHYFSQAESATLYKAAHHGSSTSHHDGLWTTLLAKDPVVLIAPFRRGNVILPKDSDVDYFKSHTDSVWTTSPRPPTPSTSFKKQAAKLGRLAQNPRDLSGMVGHLRARIPASGGTWKIDTFPPAIRL